MGLRTLFATPIYEASLDDGPAFAPFNDELAAACRSIADEDRAGRSWSKANGYRGYTSYASLSDLPTRASVFGTLKRRLEKHALTFAQDLAFDLGRRPLKLDSLWINLLRGGGAHSGHIHPHSVLSGTLYVETPPGAGAIRFEDPRLPMMMASPMRRADAPETLKTFVSIAPRPGDLLMWESWLRHEVLPNVGREERISISFNFGWR